jgi:hypothetical protein
MSQQISETSYHKAESDETPPLFAANTENTEKEGQILPRMTLRMSSGQANDTDSRSIFVGAASRRDRGMSHRGGDAAPTGKETGQRKRQARRLPASGGAEGDQGLSHDLKKDKRPVLRLAPLRQNETSCSA